MKVSVVIPCYNAAVTVRESVESVLNQSEPVHEILAVDDGSTDGTAAVLQGLPVTLIRQANAGVAMARNAGIDAASGDCVAFLDSDDVWHPRKLELQLPHIQKFGLIAANCYNWPGNVPELVDAPPQPIRLNKLVVRNSIVTSTVIVRREVLKQAGPFDSRLQGPEDYDLWLRIAQIGDCTWMPQPLCGYRAVEGSLSRNAARMEAGMRIILEKLETAGVFRHRPLLRRKAWGYFHYSCGYMHHCAGNRSQAKSHLKQSLVKYPFWYCSDDVRHLFGRLRLLIKS